MAMKRACIRLNTNSYEQNHASSIQPLKINFIRIKYLILCMSTLFFGVYATAQEKNQVVRVAELQIDSIQLENYKTALKEEIETSVRVEPGVISLYAVAEKDKPNHILVFEIYADTNAYKAHRETPHFKKYKTATKEMVKSLKLKEAVPVILETKTKKR
jgi:quinol monooxygenase YgiN